jgi:membrane protein YqaA with SNARE-associated domain
MTPDRDLGREGKYMRGIASSLVWRQKTITNPRVGSKQNQIARFVALKRRGLELPLREEAAPKAKKGFWHRERLLQILALFFVLILCGFIYIFRNMIESLGGYGYLGAFLVPMLCSATLVVPAPGLMVVITLGGVLNPLFIGLISGVGGTMGEMTGYLLGYSGRAAIENVSLYQRMEYSMKRWGAITLFVLALIPNPLFDVAGAVAGALRFPLWKFLLYGGIGRIIKHTFFAFAGAWGIEFILRFLD